MARIDPKKAARIAASGAALAVKYGPQAKLAWDKGGKQAAQAAVRRAAAVRAKRNALAHASGLIDGGVLPLAPGGDKVFVVLTGTTPLAVYPPVEGPLSDLVEHADLSRVIRPETAPPSRPGPQLRPAAARQIQRVRNTLFGSGA